MSISKQYILYWTDFLIAMTAKEIGARYKNARFGFLWMIINPLSQMLVLGFVFRYIVPIKVDNYFIFLFSGLLAWNFFSQSLTKATTTFYYERNLIKKAIFPRESIVLSIIFSNLLHTMITLVIFILFLIISNFIFNSFTSEQFLFSLIRMLWVIPGLCLLVVFLIGMSLITASLNVRFRDINFFVQLTVQLWFYATPIIYTLALLPSAFLPLFYMNPITLVVEIFQYALLDLTPTSLALAPISIIVVLLTFYLGVRIFIKESKYFDDWL